MLTLLSLGNALITDETATVTVTGLKCGVNYTIIAGGTSNGELVGPRSSHGTIVMPTCPVDGEGISGSDEGKNNCLMVKIVYIKCRCINYCIAYILP